MTQLSSKRRSLSIWLVCCILAGAVFLVYALTSLAAGHGEFVMPLDDTYIHFQYAKQLASGQPYVYNPGQPPTSGATSFVYPYVLAVGYLLGFQGLNLGLWAMLVGMLALAGSTWLVYLISRALDAPDWLALLAAVLFALSGAVSWHFMSGMETGLAVLCTLATLYTVVTTRPRGFVIAASLLALIRPEGGIAAVLAVGAMFWQLRAQSNRRIYPWLLVPVLAVGVQPLVNLLITGSAVATGNQAKSLLSLIPPDKDVIITRIADNFVRMWREFLFPTDEFASDILAVMGMGIVALWGLVGLLLKREHRVLGVLLLLWLLSGTLAISTLDTAFWHFKRYQMPLAVLFYPLAGVGVLLFVRGLKRILKAVGGLNELTAALAITSVVIAGFAVLAVAAAFPSSWQFLKAYFLNANEVYQQPLQMARWLAANTPPDATVAVHDVGMMRYMGGRTTIDMVGLTTPGAADAWRNGPGAVAEFLARFRPEYVAAYTDARGLSYLADTGIYGELLASYRVDYDERTNVALAGHFQGIYRTNWSAADHVNEVLQPSILHYLQGVPNGYFFHPNVDVGDLVSESAVDYQWNHEESLTGFPTEVYEQDYVDCAIASCTLLDGGRRINGDESFTLTLSGDSAVQTDIILVTRLHPVNAGTLDIYVVNPGGNPDELVATRWIPAIPGHWLEIATLIPANLASNTTRIRIVPHIPGGYYMPYYHWFYAVAYQPELSDAKPLATFQSGAIKLMSATPAYQPGQAQLPVKLTWQTDHGAQGDYVVFVHLYNDIAQPPIAQTDLRPGNGTLPPGNWLPGTIRDTMNIDLTHVPPGNYQVAIGMYDPQTNQRLPPDSGGDKDGRLFIGEVEIK